MQENAIILFEKEVIIMNINKWKNVKEVRFEWENGKK